ncbi:MAG TPA: right-handed parallel beta-helix repeat-containing protein [Thermoanaerobaculia bacterium]|nr:right-handed parallel beta-helix repeat-containing protein [Thermoanaerobaculia bacterium]
MLRSSLVTLAFLFLPTLASAQNLTIDLTPGPSDEAAGTQVVRSTIQNPKPTAVSLVAFEIYSHPARVVTVSGNGWECWDAEPGHQICHLATPIDPGATNTADFTLQLPLKAGRTRVTAVTRWNEPVAVFDTLDLVMYRRFVVTQNGDDGKGSLRDAIQSLNVENACRTEPCRIDFAIDGDINVLSPLPPVTAVDLLIDGESKIDIRGDALTAGEGLQIDSPSVTIRGLSVSRFPFSGIAIHPPSPVFGNTHFVFEHNRLIENGHRGLVILPGFAYGSIDSNDFERNGRSGLFVAGKQSPGFLLAPAVTVTNNRVIDNGASGMVFGPVSDGALVSNNVISGNRDFGVAIGTNVRNMRVESNVITDNGISAIDIGLDGATRVTTIRSAKFDAETGRTTISGTGPAISYGTYTQVLYASDAPGDVQELAGSVVAVPNTGEFTAVLERDLRGKYISAITMRTINADGSLIYDTSELSNAIRVQ